jgi:predicted HTH transcriptional regulator
MLSDIQAVVESGVLPPEKEKAVGALLEGDNNFVSVEGQYWDFKREWPFSYSDDYFAGIARLICGFANAAGGLIIFGVHDDLRTAGHNKVAPNVDRMQQALNQLLTDEIAISLRRYDIGTDKAIEVLLVPPLSKASRPI